MRIFDIMTVQLHTTDVNSKVVSLAGIPYNNIVEQIRSLVNEASSKNRIFEQTNLYYEEIELPIVTRGSYFFL